MIIFNSEIICNSSIVIVVTAVLAFDFLMSSFKLSCWYYHGGVGIDTSDPLLFISGQSQVSQIFGGVF